MPPTNVTDSRSGEPAGGFSRRGVPGVEAGSASTVFFALLIALLAVVYFASAKLGLSLAPLHKNVSLVWPPTGIALAAVLLLGYRAWPGIALGAFLINASTRVGLAVAGRIAVVSQTVFGGWFATGAINSPLGFAIFPFSIWAALRFSQREAATTTLVASAIAIWDTARQVGPFAGQTLTESFLLLQAFMSVVAVTALVLGAATGGRRRVEEALQQSERRYRELFENATLMVYTADPDGRF